MGDLYKKIVEEGKQNMILQIADKMIKGGEPDDKIVEYTGLTKKKIDKYRKQLHLKQPFS